MKTKIEEILSRELPKFHTRTSQNRGFGGDFIGIDISCSNKNINQVAGQNPQRVSLLFYLDELRFFAVHTSIYRKINPEEPKERFLAMQNIKVPFRQPLRNEKAVLAAIERFCKAYKKAIEENIDVLMYQDIVNYKELL